MLKSPNTEKHDLWVLLWSRCISMISHKSHWIFLTEFLMLIMMVCTILSRQIFIWHIFSRLMHLTDVSQSQNSIHETSSLDYQWFMILKSEKFVNNLYKLVPERLTPEKLTHFHDFEGTKMRQSFRDDCTRYN